MLSSTLCTPWPRKIGAHRFEDRALRAGWRWTHCPGHAPGVGYFISVPASAGAFALVPPVLFLDSCLLMSTRLFYSAAPLLLPSLVSLGGSPLALITTQSISHEHLDEFNSGCTLLFSSACFGHLCHLLIGCCCLICSWSILVFVCECMCLCVRLVKH